MKIVLPTRNRPTALQGALGYYERFYPTADLLIADGSSDRFKQANQDVIDKAGVDVDYQPYDEEMPFFERLLTVITALDDELLAIGADDDFPMPETLEKAERRLLATPDAVCASGHLIHLDVLKDGTGIARLDDVRTIAADGVAQRFRRFSASRFTTYYGVARRSLLVARYEFLMSWNVPGFFDYSVGLNDLAHGKFIAIPQLGHLCTRNRTHSYFRPNQPQVYLREAARLLDFRQRLLDRLAAPDGCEPDEAHRIVSTILDRMVASAAAAPPQRLAGFTQAYPYNTDLAAQARQQFADLFHEGTEERKRYADRLAFIGECVQRSIASADNDGEGFWRESI